MNENRVTAFINEYSETAEKLIYIIKNVKFLQERKAGYDGEQVDEFLDSLILEFDMHSKYEKVGSLINTTTIVDVKFGVIKMGYNIGQVDDFLDLLEMEIEKLNEIKLRYF